MAKLSGMTQKEGTSPEGIIRAAKRLGFNVFMKKNSSLADLRQFIKRKIPVIVDWFLEDDGHYSVVVDIDKKNITLMDPTLRKILIYVRRRKMPLDYFFRVWFDFPGNYIKNPRDLVLRLMLVITPD